MPQAENMRLASQIIAYGSAAAPSKFPKDDPIVLNVWADVLETINVPEDLWPEAIRYWAATTHTDTMAGPWDIIYAAKQVIKQWERDESKKYILEAHRWKHRVARAKRNYGDQFEMHKVVPPPHWTGIDATQDPEGHDVVEIARAGWHRAQQQPPEVEMQPEEFFARLKRGINKNRLPAPEEDTQPPQNTPYKPHRRTNTTPVGKTSPERK